VEDYSVNCTRLMHASRLHMDKTKLTSRMTKHQVIKEEASSCSRDLLAKILDPLLNVFLI